MCPLLRHGLCCLTPKCVTLATLKPTWIIQEAPDYSDLSESLSNSLTLLSLPPASSHSQSAFRPVTKILKSFGLSTRRSCIPLTSNIPSWVRLPPQMPGFWDLTANQPKSHCNALFGLCCFGLETCVNQISGTASQSSNSPAQYPLSTLQSH